MRTVERNLENVIVDLVDCVNVAEHGDHLLFLKEFLLLERSNIDLQTRTVNIEERIRETEREEPTSIRVRRSFTYCFSVVMISRMTFCLFCSIAPSVAVIEPSTVSAKVRTLPSSLQPLQDRISTKTTNTRC